MMERCPLHKSSEGPIMFIIPLPEHTRTVLLILMLCVSVPSFQMRLPPCRPALPSIRPLRLYNQLQIFPYHTSLWPYVSFIKSLSLCLTVSLLLSLCVCLSALISVFCLQTGLLLFRLLVKVWPWTSATPSTASCRFNFILIFTKAPGRLSRTEHRKVNAHTHKHISFQKSLKHTNTEFLQSEHHGHSTWELQNRCLNEPQSAGKVSDISYTIFPQAVQSSWQLRKCFLNVWPFSLIGLA